eukprot:3002637-Prymnesium_polylepis.1
MAPLCSLASDCIALSAARRARPAAAAVPGGITLEELANLDAELDNYATSNWMLRARIWSNSAGELYVIAMCA